ncbi:hypothetical protein D3C73_933240 [compost metagenome]
MVLVIELQYGKVTSRSDVQVIVAIGVALTFDRFLHEGTVLEIEVTFRVLDHRPHEVFELFIRDAVLVGLVAGVRFDLCTLHLIEQIHLVDVVVHRYRIEERSRSQRKHRIRAIEHEEVA